MEVRKLGYRVCGDGYSPAALAKLPDWNAEPADLVGEVCLDAGAGKPTAPAAPCVASSTAPQCCPLHTPAARFVGVRLFVEAVRFRWQKRLSKMVIDLPIQENLSGASPCRLHCAGQIARLGRTGLTARQSKPLLPRPGYPNSITGHEMTACTTIRCSRGQRIDGPILEQRRVSLRCLRSKNANQLVQARPPRRLPLEEKRFERSNPLACEQHRVGFRVLAIEHEHRQAVMPVVADEGAETEPTRLVIGDSIDLGADRNQLDEGVVKLD